MKHILLVILITVLVLVSCKKKDPAAEIEGDYNFTIKASLIMVPWHQPKDAVFSYAGSIVRESSNYVIINKTPPYEYYLQRLPLLPSGGCFPGNV
jgi:hypothetical protein